jgi:hypothetical protein
MNDSLDDDILANVEATHPTPESAAQPPETQPNNPTGTDSGRESGCVRRLVLSVFVLGKQSLNQFVHLRFLIVRVLRTIRNVHPDCQMIRKWSDWARRRVNSIPTKWALTFFN